jgi:hypothetical protein
LVSGRSNHKLWVHSFTGPVNDPRDLARQIASATGAAIQARTEPRRSP